MSSCTFKKREGSIIILEPPPIDLRLFPPHVSIFTDYTTSTRTPE